MALKRKIREDKATFIQRVTPVVQTLGMPLLDRPIPESAAQAIAARAVKGRDVQKDLLVYGVLGHYWRKSAGSIKGLIQRTKRDYPDLRDW